MTAPLLPRLVLPNVTAAATLGGAMFLSCPRCDAERVGGNLIVMLTPLGLEVWCSGHDLHIGTLTPESLSALMAHPPLCECCRGKGTPS